MISFVYDHRGIIVTRVPCGTSVKAAYYRDWMQKVRRNMHKNRLARGWATHFARQCTPAPGEGCDRFAELIRVGSVTSRAIQSGHESAGLRLISKVKKPMRGHCFSSLEEVSAAITRAI